MKGARPGVNAACITPFNQDGSIDEGALRAHLDWLGSAGVGIYLPLVGTGEAQLLRDAEVRRTWEIGVEQLKGKVPVYACGIGPTDTPHTIAMTREAEAVGVDGVYVYTPRPLPAPTPQPPKVIDTFFREFLDAVRCPIHIANNPFIIGYPTPVDLMDQVLSRYDNIASICNAHGSLTYVANLLDAVRDRTSVFEINTGNMLSFLALGGHGTLCIEANVAPRLCVSIYNAFKQGDVARAAQLFPKLVRLQGATGKHTNPTGIKAALNILGLPGRYSRKPYLAPDDAEQKELARVLDELEIRKIEGIR